MRKPSLRAALRQEIRRAVARQGDAIAKRLDRARTRLKSLRATLRKQSAELARAQRRLEKLRLGRAAGRRAAAGPSGPAMSPAQIRAVRGAQPRRVFAEKLGVSANSIFLWETGRARPRGGNLARLARAKPRGGKRGPGRPRKAGARKRGRRAAAKAA
jgi:DNA-binding transcriptional regulator YiaG